MSTAYRVGPIWSPGTLSPLTAAPGCPSGVTITHNRQICPSGNPRYWEDVVVGAECLVQQCGPSQLAIDSLVSWLRGIHLVPLTRISFSL